MSVYRMPSLGADMEEAKLTAWLVATGDKVARGDVVAVVETQKGAIEIEIFEAGVVVELLAQPGEILPVGAPLARLATADDVAGADVPAQKPIAEPAVVLAPRLPASQPVSDTQPPVRPEPVAAAGALASPAARNRAADAGLALSDVVGSGPGGAVLLSDVDRHLTARLAKAAPVATDAPLKAKPGLDMTEMRRAIAVAMARSKREIPHYYLSHEIDLQSAQDWLEAENAVRTPDRRLLMGALLVRATVRALARVPELNGRFESDTFAPATATHCGLAIAMRGGGLIAPAILDAGDKGTDALMDAMRDLVARTRAGRLRNSEVTQGTITISSLGETGVDALFGVIYPPQVALVGFGAPRFKPMVLDRTVAARLALTATLAADHRVSDGRRGALFLSEIDRLLQEPGNL